MNAHDVTPEPEVPVKPKRVKKHDPDNWVEPFLEHYEKWGAISLAAKEMGMRAPIVYRYKATHPEFVKRLEEAHEVFVDELEKTMLIMARTGKNTYGFTACVARLKAERPNKWNDKLQVSGAVAHLHAGPAPDAVKALLKEMLLDSSADTRKALTDGNVIEAEIAKPEEGGGTHQQEVLAAK